MVSFQTTSIIRILSSIKAVKMDSHLLRMAVEQLMPVIVIGNLQKHLHHQQKHFNQGSCFKADYLYCSQQISFDFVQKQFVITPTMPVLTPITKKVIIKQA